MILWGKKDGGPESKVYAYGIEIKSLFSVLVLKFEKGSREAYHTHAFNAVSWLVKGSLGETLYEEAPYLHQHRFYWHSPSFWPIWTPRSRNHKVSGIMPTNWVLTFRGPWSKTWTEYRIKEGREVTLTYGRKEITGDTPYRKSMGNTCPTCLGRGDIVTEVCPNCKGVSLFHD